MMDDGSNSTGHSMEIPDTIVESLARCLFPKLLEFFESPEGQAEFAAWKEQQNEIK